MKNLKKSFLAFIAAFAVSCGDPELPVELFPEMEYGAYARKMSQTGEFNYFAIESSALDIHVEYYDANQGANIAQYDIDVEYVDMIDGGAKSVARKDMRTISASEFTTNADGYLSSDINLGFSATMSTLGITQDDIDGGSYFRYWFTITMTDGRVFDYNNTGPNLVSSSAFAALFRLNAYIVCPSSLEGDVIVDSEDAGLSNLSGWTFSVTGHVDELIKVGSADNIYTLKNDMTCGAWAHPNINYSVRAAIGPAFTDACNVMSISGSDNYGEGWSMLPGSASVSADSKVFTYDWYNTWGEAARANMRYADGSTWPALTN